MSIVEKFMNLLDGNNISSTDLDINTFLELNIGKFIQYHEDEVCFSSDFEFNPEDFIQDVAFLSLLSETPEEKELFHNWIYDIFYAYWQENNMDERDFLDAIQNSATEFYSL